MDDCRAPHFKKLLYAYELGLLKDEQRRELELHILECEFCQEEIKQFEPTISAMRSSARVRDSIAQLTGDEIEGRPDAVTESSASAGRNRRLYAIGAFVAAAIFVFLILKPWDIEFQPTKEATAAENRIIVMGFENLTDESDSEKLGRAITSLLIADLSESRYLQVVSSQRLHDIIDLIDKKGNKAINQDLTARILEKTNARWMLMGSIIQTTPNLVLAFEVIEVSSGTIIMSRRLRAAPNEDYFSLVDRITVEVKNSLSLPAAAWSEPDPAIADVTTHSPDAYRAYLEGVAYYDKFYLKEANECNRRALEYDSTFAMAYYNLAFLGDPEILAKAVKYSNKATRKEQLYIRSLEARMNGDRDLAIRYLLELVEKYPDEKMALFELAIYMEQKKNYTETIRYFNEILKIDPLYKMAYNYMAYAYVYFNQLDSALSVAEKYIEIAPDEPNPYDTYGELLARQGKLDGAIEMYEKVYSMEPDFADYTSLLTLGRLNVFRQHYSRASELFQEAATHGGIDIRPIARTCLALVPLYQGKFSKTLEILDDGIAADRMDKSDKSEFGLIKYKIKAEALEEMGHLDEARLELEKAIEIQGALYSDTGLDLGSVYMSVLGKQGDTTRAEKIVDELKNAMADDNDAARQAYWRGMAHYRFSRGKFMETIDWFQKLAADEVVSYGDSLYLGQAFLRLDEFEKAATTYEKLLSNYFIDSRLTNAFWVVKVDYYLGLAYENMNQPEKAMTHYTKFIDILHEADIAIPEMGTAQNRLLLLKQGS